MRVQVLGVEPGDGLRNVRLTSGSGGASTTVTLGEPCGLGCFAGTTTFDKAGDWQLAVSIDSNRGPISSLNPRTKSSARRAIVTSCASVVSNGVRLPTEHYESRH